MMLCGWKGKLWAWQKVMAYWKVFWTSVNVWRRYKLNQSYASCFMTFSVQFSFYAPQLYRQVLLRRVLAMAILSVCPSVRPSVRLSRPGAETTEWHRDSGSSPYDSLVSLASNEVILVRLGGEIPLERGHQRGVPPLEIVILELLAHLAWKRLQIDTDLLRIITSTADELSSGTNIDDLERPWPPKLGFLGNF